MQLLDCFLYIIYPEFSLGLSLGLMQRTIFFYFITLLTPLYHALRLSIIGVY